MAKRRAGKVSYIPTQGLRLKQMNDGRFIDQYGRILEYYRNREGKMDLRPVGVGYATH